jgi:hypothetical protein
MRGKEASRQARCPGKTSGVSWREIILGVSATKLWVLLAFFLLNNHFEQKQNHRLRGTLGNVLTLCGPWAA